MLQHHGGIALSRGEQEAQGRAHSERHQHADEGHQKSGLPGVFQLPHVGGHAGAEHHDDDADLRDGVQKIAGLHNAQHPGPEDQAGQQRAHNLGQLQLLGDQAEHLGAQQNQRDVQQKIIRFQKYYPFLSGGSANNTRVYYRQNFRFFNPQFDPGPWPDGPGRVPARGNNIPPLRGAPGF